MGVRCPGGESARHDTDPHVLQPHKKLRRRQRLGQYRIDRHLGTGGFSSVYAATDTISGRAVALKVLHEAEAGEGFEALRREVRIAARLDHPNILPIRTAGHVEDRFVIVTPQARESLDERLKRRLGARTVVEIAGQLLAALAEAHDRRVVHCDIKPDNVLLFPGNRIQLADFGLARLALKSIDASGSGTVGYMAPEQALGKPSLRSDVFSAGLLIWRMMAGARPEWPFEWPFPGTDRARRLFSKELIDLVRKAVQVDERRRFASCVPMEREFRRIEETAVRQARR